MWPFGNSASKNYGGAKNKRMTLRLYPDQSIALESHDVDEDGLTTVTHLDKLIRAWESPLSLVDFHGLGNIPAQRIMVAFDLDSRPINVHDPEPDKTKEEYQRYFSHIVTRKSEHYQNTIEPGNIHLNKIFWVGAVIALLLVLPFLFNAWPGG